MPNKWINEIGDIQIDEWKKINEKLNYIKEVKLRDFQFMINNCILVTHSFLFKIKKKDTNRCSYCNQEAESNTHLFLVCGKVVEFWKI